MAQATTIDQKEQQHEDSDSTHAEFFNAVRNGTVEQVINFLSQLNSTNTTVTDETTIYTQTLLKALAEKNAGEVWRLIAQGSEEEIKTLETLNSICETVAEHERLREAGLFSCMLGKLKSQIRCNGPCGCGRSGRERGGENYQLEREEEQQWINIEGALHDANLLEKIALYEHHYS